MQLRTLVFAMLLGCASAAGAATFTVNSTVDEIDSNQGDGECLSTPSGLCTLRAAIMEANVDGVSDTINLPAGVYTLSIAGTLEDNAEQGDLDIRASVTIQGAGVSATIIDR